MRVAESLPIDVTGMSNVVTLQSGQYALTALLNSGSIVFL